MEAAVETFKQENPEAGIVTVDVDGDGKDGFLAPDMDGPRPRGLPMAHSR